MRRAASLAVLAAVLVSSLTGMANRPALGGANGEVGGEKTDLAEPIEWLAIGDSYSSGEGAERGQEGCARSSLTYSMVAHDILSENGPNWQQSKPQLLACSGAKASGSGDNDLPAQLDEVGGQRFDLITLTIGGNDMKFTDVMKKCVRKSLIRSCDDLEKPLYDRMAEVEQTLDTTYQELKDQYLNSGGRIVVLGYPWLFEPSEEWQSLTKRACSLFDADDADMLRDVAMDFNTVLESTVGAHDLEFLDAQVGFDGHNLCADDEWIHPIADPSVGTRYQSWLHPRTEGYEWEGEQLADLVAQFDFGSGDTPDGDDDLAPLVGTWQYQGEFPLDVATLTVNEDGTAEHVAEGAPYPDTGEAIPNGDLEYQLQLCNEECDSQAYDATAVVDKSAEFLALDDGRIFHKLWGLRPTTGATATAASAAAATAPITEAEIDEFANACFAGELTDKARSHHYFEPDGQRAQGAQACLTRQTIRGGKPASYSPAGFDMTRTDSDFGPADSIGPARCHLIANILGGYGGRKNLVTCSQNPINVGGMRKHFETPTKKDVLAEPPVYYLVIPLYHGNKLMPYAITMYRRYPDGTEVGTTFLNLIKNRRTQQLVNLGDLY